MAARINFEVGKIHLDHRFLELVIKLGSRRAAYGALMEAFIVAQRYWVPERKRIPISIYSDERLATELIEVGFAEQNEEGIYIRGSEEQFAWLIQRSKAGSKKTGAKKAPRKQKEISNEEDNLDTPRSVPLNGMEPLYSSLFSLNSNTLNSENIIAGAIENDSPTPDESKVANPDGPSPTALTWRSYRAAYEKRYGAAPPWNAKLGGQLRSFTARVPSAEAPDIAAFYVGHNDSKYTKNMHPVGMLLQDAEKLRTEWVTGLRMTSVKARAGEKVSHAKDQLERIARGEL